MPASLIIPAAVEIVTRTSGDGFEVAPIFANVDRPHTGGWVVSRRSVAERLKAALLSGDAYESTEVVEDVNGKTYVATKAKVYGRTMNADLKRIGY